MKLIFLDIDGVLINQATCRHFGVVDPACVKELNRLTDTTGAKIVLSSCWRIGWPVKEVQRHFKEKWGITGEVIGKTPVDWNQERGNEIQMWIDEFLHTDTIESIVIIDDDRDMAHLLPFLVQTTFTWGLTPTLADEAISKLNNKFAVEISDNSVENPT